MLPADEGDHQGEERRIRRSRGAVHEPGEVEVPVEAEEQHTAQSGEAAQAVGGASHRSRQTQLLDVAAPFTDGGGDPHRERDQGVELRPGHRDPAGHVLLAQVKRGEHVAEAHVGVGSPSVGHAVPHHEEVGEHEPGPGREHQQRRTGLPAGHAHGMGEYRQDVHAQRGGDGPFHVADQFVQHPASEGGVLIDAGAQQPCGLGAAVAVIGKACARHGAPRVVDDGPVPAWRARLVARESRCRGAVVPTPDERHGNRCVTVEAKSTGHMRTGLPLLRSGEYVRHGWTKHGPSGVDQAEPSPGPSMG